MTMSYDLNLLENLTEQQQQLVETLQCTCQQVEQYATGSVTEHDLSVIRDQLTAIKERLACNCKLTSQLAEHLEQDTALVNVECEEFDYWCS